MKDNDPLFKNAENYFRYFLQKDIKMVISTISIAEYCCGGDIYELPLKNLQILPFNIDHAKRAGEFARIIYQERRDGNIKVEERTIIPNDTKLFSQADIDTHIDMYLSSDTRSQKIYDVLQKKSPPKFQFVDLNIPRSQVLGILDL